MTWFLEEDKLENWAYMEKVFTPKECELIIDIASYKEKLEAAIGNIKNPINKEIRDSKIVWLDGGDNIDWIYGRLTSATMPLNKKYFNFDLTGFMEKLQFTEYSIGGMYRKHIDRSLGGTHRKMSIVVQLTDPSQYEGGELELHYQETPAIAYKEQGTLIMFPSYTLHQVTPVTKGKRHSLVAWISGKPLR